MPRFAVRTLTLNPAIDVWSEADKVAPERKIRTCCERIDPGGGGINVARALARFGVAVEAVFLAGGATGRALEEMLDRERITCRCVPLAEDTRMSLTIHERSTGSEYRFVPEGPTITPREIEAAREAIIAESSDYLVASGSLPPGIPDDFYGGVSKIARRQGSRFILDTYGSELKAALSSGGLFLLKASREEVDARGAQQIVESGEAEYVALTLGADGALLIGAEGTFALPAVVTDPVSTVGAGDSFLAGMTYGLTQKQPPLESFRLAVAFAAAATLSPGTDLAHPEHVDRLLGEVGEPRRL